MVQKACLRNVYVAWLRPCIRPSFSPNGRSPRRKCHVFPSRGCRRGRAGRLWALTRAPGGSAEGGTPVGAERRVAGHVCSPWGQGYLGQGTRGACWPGKAMSCPGGGDEGLWRSQRVELHTVRCALSCGELYPDLKHVGLPESSLLPSNYEKPCPGLAWPAPDGQALCSRLCLCPLPTLPHTRPPARPSDDNHLSPHRGSFRHHLCPRREPITGHPAGRGGPSTLRTS